MRAVLQIPKDIEREIVAGITLRDAVGISLFKLPCDFDQLNRQILERLKLFSLLTLVTWRLL